MTEKTGISDSDEKVVEIEMERLRNFTNHVLYDEQMTAALVGRLMHHCHLILFLGENNRLRESSINDLFAAQRGAYATLRNLPLQLFGSASAFLGNLYLQKTSYCGAACRRIG